MTQYIMDGLPQDTTIQLCLRQTFLAVPSPKITPLIQNMLHIPTQYDL